MSNLINDFDIRVLREIARRYGGENKRASWQTRQITGEEDNKLFTETLYKVCARLEEIGAQYPNGVPTPNPMQISESAQ